MSTWNIESSEFPDREVAYVTEEHVYMCVFRNENFKTVNLIFLVL